MSHADRSFEGGLQNHGSADNLSYDDIMAFAARPPSSGVRLVSSWAAGEGGEG